jgi:hypothetical protein
VHQTRHAAHEQTLQRHLVRLRNMADAADTTPQLCHPERSRAIRNFVRAPKQA